MRKFVRTRAPPPAPPAHPALNGHAHKTNGHAYGEAERRDDQQSTLSRYWSGSEESAGAIAAGAGGALFEDDTFPASWRALGNKRCARSLRWMRPHELCARPRFRGDERIGPLSGPPGGPLAGPPGLPGDLYPDYEVDPARWQVEAGSLGGACVCVAAAALSQLPRLLDRALPPHSFQHRYTGAFRFRFWVFGSWREVVVDDRLPVRGGRVAGACAARRDDFTLALLHKAYAKLHGGYARLHANTARALLDLSGGVVQSVALRRQPRALLLQLLGAAAPRSTLLVASPRRHAHACCVTGLARGSALLRLRALPPRAPFRPATPPPDCDALSERPDEPGEFWMSFADFTQAFDSLELVHIGPDDWLREPALHARRPWRAVLARRRWRHGYNAGGPPTCTETTSTNPQFHIDIPRVERKCHVVVSVTQQYSPGAPGRLHAVGFCVYELRAGAAPHRPLALPTLRALDVTHECRAREVATFFTLAAGSYLLVPHTRRAHTDAAFLLRVLTDEQAAVWELNEDNALVEAGEAAPGADDGSALDARALGAVLRGAGRAVLGAAPSRALCAALVALHDAALAGAMPARALPALLARLASWRGAFLAQAARGCGAPRVSSYRLRALLRGAGVAASNKVLEALVLRFARRAQLTEEACVLALARLHLAHERYRSLDSKLKSNPLSLEEMILMTIYS